MMIIYIYIYIYIYIISTKTVLGNDKFLSSVSDISIIMKN